MRLGAFVSVRKGRKPRAIVDELLPGYRRLLQIDDLRPDAKLKFCPPTADEVLAHPGDVVIAWDGANAGTSSFGLSGVVGSTLAILRPKGREVFTPYLGHFVGSRKDYLRERSYGATVPHIDGRTLNDLDVPLPSLPEQRRIADVLDRAEGLRAKRRAALARLRGLTQALFVDLFGDMATNPQGWPVTRLGELCDRVIDCPHATPIYVDGITPYPCVRSSDIQDNALDLTNAKFVNRSEYEKRIARGRPQPGDVIYCREGARFGNAARVIDETLLCLGQRTMLFRPKQTLAVTEYIWAYLSSPAGYRQAARNVGGSAAPHVNIREIVAFRVPLPPIALQRDFAHRVATIDSLIDVNRASLAGLDRLHSTIEHLSFVGRL